MMRLSFASLMMLCIFSSLASLAIFFMEIEIFVSIHRLLSAMGLFLLGLAIVVGRRERRTLVRTKVLANFDR